MNIATLALLIPIIAILAGLIIKLSEASRARQAMNAQQDRAMAQLQAEISGLKSRIAILETLVTDEGFQLKRNIDSA